MTSEPDSAHDDKMGVEFVEIRPGVFMPAAGQYEAARRLFGIESEPDTWTVTIGPSQQLSSLDQ